MGPYDKGFCKYFVDTDHCHGTYDKGFTNTFWTETLVMGPYGKGFASTLWTQTIVMEPYDKEFTNTFWRYSGHGTVWQGFYKYFVDTYNCHGTVWQGVYKHFLDRDHCHGTVWQGFYKYFVDTYNCHGTVWQGFTNTLWANDPFLVNVYYNGTTNTMKRHKVCQGSTSTLYMFVWWCSRHFQQYFSSIGRSGIIGGGNRWTRRKPPICRKSLTNFITMVYTLPWSWFELTTSVVIGTDYIDSCIPTTMRSQPIRPLYT
jgi:hypothetical protein